MKMNYKKVDLSKITKTLEDTLYESKSVDRKESYIAPERKTSTNFKFKNYRKALSPQPKISSNNSRNFGFGTSLRIPSLEKASLNKMTVNSNNDRRVSVFFTINLVFLK